MKRLSLVLSILLLLVTLSACNTPTENTYSDKNVIRIAYLPITHSIPILVQNELQIDNSEYKIELVKFTTWPELVDALRQNKVDGASVLFEVALKAMETSDDLKLVSLSHRDGNVVVSSNDVQSFKDLSGKTVAIPHKLSPHHTLLKTILEIEEMSIDDLKVVELAPADMPSSLVSGAISAFVVAEPYGSISVSSSTGKILYNSVDVKEHSICCAMMFHSNFLDNNPNLTDLFISDFHKAAEEADKKDAFVVKVYGKYMKLKEDIIIKSLETISFKDLAMSEEEYSEVAKSIIKYSILDNVPDYADLIYDKSRP